MVLGWGILGAVLPAAGQSVKEAFTPYVNAGDMQEMERDGRGHLWIATSGGALRFDLTTGEFEAFPRLLGTGPRGNDLVTVCVDPLGRVWFGSATRGFTYYDPVTQIWDRDSEEWPDPHIRVIRCLGGGIYIGTGGGLSLKPTLSRTDICAAADPGCIVPSYVVNDYALLGDTLWVATEEGLGRFNGITWDSAGALPSASLGQESRSLAVHEGTLWEATFDRVRKLENGVWLSAPFTVHRLVESEGNLYALQANKVYRLEEPGWIDLNVPLNPGEQVRDLEVFGSDMYLALGGGLALWQGGPSLSRRFVPAGPGLTGVYTGMAVDADGVVWAGTSERTIGLVRFDGSSWRTTVSPGMGLSESWILSMIASRRDEVWIGHCCCQNPPDCPLQVLENDQITFPYAILNAWAFAEDPRGILWVGTQGLGLHVLDSTPFTITSQSTGGTMASDRITAVAVTQEGTTIGYDSDGLDYWPHGGDLSRGVDGANWIHVAEGGFGLLDESVESMTLRNGEVWAATASGIHHLQGAVVLERCPAKDAGDFADPSRKVNVIAGDLLGGLWVGTDTGLLYLPSGRACDAVGGDFLVFTDQNSPLPANKVTAVARSPRDGAMWFGTAEGLLRVDPLVLTGRTPPPDEYVLYPNPLQPSSGSAARRTVTFGIERSGIRVEPVAASLAAEPKVYDLTGRPVGAFVLDTRVGTGAWVWTGTNHNGDTVAPGIYVVQTAVDGERVTLKLGVVR